MKKRFSLSSPLIFLFLLCLSFFGVHYVLALTSVTLNNGTTTLSTSSPLTSQEDLAAGEIGAYTWTKNGQNVAALNIPFNSGATQNDYSGNGNNGTVTNAVVTTSGCQVGTCMTFDGSGDYVTIPDSAVWSFSDALTVSLWYSSTQANASGQSLISQGTSASNYSFTYWASGSTTNDNMSLYIQTNNSGTISTTCGRTEGTLFDGTWHHYVGVYDRSTNQLKMYIDGAPACGSVTVPDEPLRDFGGGVHLGRLPFSTSYANGILDEVQIYDFVLTDSQIDQLYSDGNSQLGGPTLWGAGETSVGEIWNLTITPITTSGSVGTPIASSNTVTIVSGTAQGSANSDINVDVNDYLTFAIQNVAAGDEPAGNQPFGAGTQITDLTSTGSNEYAISGELGTPVYTLLETTTNSADGYTVTAYAANSDGRTNALLRSGGTAATADDEISDTLAQLPASQQTAASLNTSSDTGLAFRLLDASTSFSLRESDEDTQWGIDDTTNNALWASLPLGSGAAQIVYDTVTFSASATTAYINWFMGIDSQQRSGTYSGQVTFSASVN